MLLEDARLGRGTGRGSSSQHHHVALCGGEGDVPALVNSEGLHCFDQLALLIESSKKAVESHPEMRCRYCRLTIICILVRFVGRKKLLAPKLGNFQP